MKALTGAENPFVQAPNVFTGECQIEISNACGCMRAIAPKKISLVIFLFPSASLLASSSSSLLNVMFCG
ncbi:hypothetical protein C7212DRAFT_338669 [Tuber magnatum]|uniref:Uncharacterized protein n=1 Tax=Tuber magnatum TaxID=42249 RepID=A0A317SDC0_9PEZI|nr:hypothetical protein C7212DRAFT_338669 [Tuber magnatum]